MSPTKSSSIRVFCRQIIADYQINYWLAILGCFFLFGLGLTLTINLVSIAPFPTELQTVDIISKWPTFENIVGWPYYLISYGLNLIIDNELLAGRLVAVWFGLITAGFLWVCLRYRYGSKSALLATGLLISNSWFLAAGGNAGPASMMIAAPILMIATWSIYKRRPNQIWPKFLVGFSLFLSLFTPFLAWLAVGQLAFLFNHWLSFSLKKSFGQFSVALMFILLVGLMIVINYQSIQLFGLDSFSLSFDDLTQTLSAFIWQAPIRPDRWLDNLPMLDVVGLTSLVFGLTVLIANLPTFDKNKKLAGLVVVIGWLLFISATGGVFSPAFEVGFGMVGLTISGGLAEIYRRWRTVFPFNQLVRVISISAIAGLVGLSLLYQAQKHFIAWPRSSATLELRQGNSN